MSDYVRGLREKIGNDFLFMPSVAALIRDEGGRILLVQHVEGRWQLPGGWVWGWICLRGRAGLSAVGR